MKNGSNNKRNFRILLLMITLILISIFTVACNTISIKDKDENDSYAVYIKDNGLYYSYLNSEEETKIQDGNSFEYPLISKLGNYIEGRKSTDELIGYNPIVWNISADGRYIYIMEKPASESLSSDGIGIGIYDTEKKTHTELKDITTLSYRNHLAINPNNNMIGLIEGAGREKVENKEVTLLEINQDKSYKTINFMGKDLVAMTPSFTLDGKGLLYSATKNVLDNNSTGFNNVYEQCDNQPHNIYEYNIETSEVKKVTKGDYFDFIPINISKDEIIFIRYNGSDHYSLIKVVNGKRRYNS